MLITINERFSWCWTFTVRTDSLDVFQRDFLRLFGAERQDVHLKSGETKSRVVLELGAEALLHHVLTALKHRATLASEPVL